MMKKKLTNTFRKKGYGPGVAFVLLKKIRVPEGTLKSNGGY